MGLYDSIARGIGKQGVMQTVDQFISSELKIAANNSGSVLARAAAPTVAKAAMQIAQKKAGKYFPQARVDKAMATLGKISPFLTIADEYQRLLKVKPGVKPDAAAAALLRGFPAINQSAVSSENEAFMSTVNPLAGGITPAMAKQMHDQLANSDLARKNLFLIEVSSVIGASFYTDTFNLFATEVEYAPTTITGEKRKVGAASIDVVQSSEPVEMRITTMDDRAGTLRMWFDEHAAATASPDGTVGVPADYSITIKVLPAFLSDEDAGYPYKGAFRVANIEVSHSRRESAIQEIQMTFVQLDTFMKA